MPKDLSYPDDTFDTAGNHYQIRGWLFPRITKAVPAGSESTVVADPLWLWALAGPLPAWGWAFLAIVSLNAMDKLGKRRNR